MRSIYIILFLSVWSILVGCDRQDDQFLSLDEMPVININTIDQEGITLREVAKDIEYIPLENRNAAFMGTIYNVYKTNDKLIIRDRQNTIFIYSLSGSLINKIRKTGNSLQEYSQISDFTVDDDNELLYVYDDVARKIIMYNYDGSFVASRNFPSKALNLTYLDRNTIISYIPERYYPKNIKTSALAMIPVPEGEIEFLSSNFESGLSVRSPYILSCLLTRSYHQNVIYKERFNDTVYVVQNDSTLIPRLVFNAGSREEQPEDYASIDSYEQIEGQKIQLWGLHFTKDYDCIAFQENYNKKVLLYHRKTGRSILSDGKGGIRNPEEGDNIDFFPVAIGEENELVGFYYPRDLKSASLKPGGQLSKINSTLSINDNPVIAVVTLKNL